MNSAGFPYKRYDNPHIYAAPSYIFLTAYSPFFYLNIDFCQLHKD